MTSDTLWQRYIYDTPFDDDEMPLLNSRMSVTDSSTEKSFRISGRSLYSLSLMDFERLCTSLKRGGYHSVVIVDDYAWLTENGRVRKGADAHMKAFCHHFQRKGFCCNITKG